MDTEPCFKYGDKVYFIPDIAAARKAEEDDTPYELPVRSVAEPYVVTDQKRISGESVNFYVKLACGGSYHQQNLIKVSEYDSCRNYTSI